MISLYQKANKEAEWLLEDFIRAIRTHESLRDAHILFCCERNTGHTAGWLANIVLKFSNTSCIAQHGDADYGWWTQAREKTQYAYEARGVFQMGNIAFIDDMVSVNRFIKVMPALKIKNIQTKFEKQLKSYVPRYTDNKKNEDKNDLAFALTFVISLLIKFLAKEIPGLNYNTLKR